MGDAVISVVVERVAAIIEDQIRYQVNLVRGVEKELLDLSDKLETVKNVLDDAERRGVKDQSVKSWLKKLEATAYEMDDILDEWNYSLLKHKMEASAEPEQKVRCCFIPSRCLCFKKVSDRRDTAKKIESVKAALDQILKEKDDFNFVISLPATDHMSKSWKIQSTSSIELEKVHGVDIDRNKNDLVSKLRLDGDSQILSIVGMGGIGKTTLAQLVYNDTQVKDTFGLRIWICVSDPFDVAAIARGIVESVQKEIIPPNINQLESVLEKVRDCISGKKFFLVLDDVWTEDSSKWEPLKINLKYGAPGSKILVTTRNERVAKMMGTLDKDLYRPEQLSDEECWSLLRRISLSGRSEEECGEFEDVGKKIASKCKGLPLAANVLGSLLQFKSSLEEWENILESEIWRLEKVEVELFPHLFLSYNELSPALKRCFSYCAVYPKDHEFHAESLIEEWMALGYLGSVSGKDGVEHKGREYFNNLVMRCLFQDFEKREIGEQIEWCKMHDIVHDFALFLRKNNEDAEIRKRSCQVCDPLLVSQVQEYRSIYWDKSTPLHLCDCLKSLRVLRFENGPPPVGMEKELIHLRWLHFRGIALSKDGLEIICRLYFLQTLCLRRCFLREIPREIGNLVQLRRLDLSGSEDLNELPESMCSLVELQILNIEGTSVRHRLPQVVGQLSNLRALELREFKVGSRYNKLGLLKKLDRLSGSLTLEIYFNSSMSEMVELVEDARQAQLKNKVHIQRLHIHFRYQMYEKEGSSTPSPPSSSSSSAAAAMWMEVLEPLMPHHNLKELTINGYKGSRLPQWMSSPLNFIKEIRLDDLSEVSSLPAMGKLPFLELLYIWDVEQMKVVGREFLGIESSSHDVVVAFPKLKKLKFWRCSSWYEWEDITEEEEESAAISIMPCLTELTIERCVCLKKLPHLLLHKASSSLRLLDIKSSSELVETYGEDKEGSPWRSISQHNPQLVLRR